MLILCQLWPQSPFLESPSFSAVPPELLLWLSQSLHFLLDITFKTYSSWPFLSSLLQNAWLWLLSCTWDMGCITERVQLCRLALPNPTASSSFGLSPAFPSLALVPSPSSWVPLPDFHFYHSSHTHSPCLPSQFSETGGASAALMV